MSQVILMTGGAGVNLHGSKFETHEELSSMTDPRLAEKNGSWRHNFDKGHDRKHRGKSDRKRAEDADNVRDALPTRNVQMSA